MHYRTIISQLKLMAGKRVFKHKILTSGSDFHRLDDLARGGIITEVEIKDIKQLVQILKNRSYKIKQE